MSIYLWQIGPIYAILTSVDIFSLSFQSFTVKSMQITVESELAQAITLNLSTFSTTRSGKREFIIYLKEAGYR